ncbi:MAG: MBL fold metallo-hydrolase [Verrucomicrobia bacterium]|nr:MBL fold metallo-hydrolase [Verrucomicrobiota bacterium]
MQAHFTFLGTGGSMGIPMVGCRCDVCTSPHKENKRLRSSGLLTVGSQRYLIDVGPDFREQALRYGIEDLSGALLTHAHSDHIAGIDDLRAYYLLHQKTVPCLLSQETYDEIKGRYHYLFRPLSPDRSVAAQIDCKILPRDFGQIDFAGLSVGYLSYFQQGMKVTGFRFGNFAYVSDIRTYSDEVFTALEGVEILVLSALRHTPTAMHFSIDEAIAFTRRVLAKTTYLTHIAHEMEHKTASALLPPDVHMSYDGLKLPIRL